MIADSFHRAIQGRHRIIGQQKSNTRVVLGPAFTVQRAETVEPGGRSMSCSNADLERKNFLGKLIVALQILKQSPEVRHGVSYSFRMISVRSTARQCLFESVARRVFPQRQVLPEEMVKTPDHAPSSWCKWLQIDALARCSRVRCVVEDIDEFVLEGILANLTQVNSDFDPRQDIFASYGVSQGYRFAKIRFVLDPFEMNVQSLQNFRLDLSLAGGGHQGRNDTSRERSLLCGNMR